MSAWCVLAKLTTPTCGGPKLDSTRINNNNNNPHEHPKIPLLSRKEASERADMITLRDKPQLVGYIHNVVVD